MNYKVNGLKGPKAETEYLLVYKIKEAMPDFNCFLATLWHYYFYYFFLTTENKIFKHYYNFSQCNVPLYNKT